MKHQIHLVNGSPSLWQTEKSQKRQDPHKRIKTKPTRPCVGLSAQCNRADKREPPLDAALKLFAQYGIAETPLSMIAKEAGVTTAMLHYYFKTREQLLDVMIDERFSASPCRIY